jgi:glyoxylase-like metal-dependent hydrolase (beta-lactamase superfamily II)
VRIKDSAEIATGNTWFDDYFTIRALDERTFAIGEPRYFQQNHSFLILGDERALLFDSGPGHRDIRPAVASVTDLPVTVTASHLHYDHVGHLHHFPQVALLDVPVLRAAVRDGVLTPPPRLHLGSMERITAHPVRVDRWLAPGDQLDLGGRRLTVLALPGHSSDGMVLIDPEANQVFAGDLLYPKGAYAVGLDSDPWDYDRSLRMLLDLIDEDTRIYVAHPGRAEVVDVPVMSRTDVVRLREGFARVLDGTARWSGLYPRKYRVDDRMSILTNARFRRSGAPVRRWGLPPRSGRSPAGRRPSSATRRRTRG